MLFCSHIHELMLVDLVIHQFRLTCLRVMISYDSLRDKMKEKGISQYALIRRWHINPAQITRLKRNESVSPHTIEMFCKILKCEVGDIMRHIPDGKA